jgi:dipeptidyl-peptidase 4
MKGWVPAALIIVCGISVIEAQQKRLTLDDIYDPQKHINIGTTPASGFVWVDATHYVWPRPAAGGNGVDWVRVDAATGTESAAFDAAKMSEAFAKLPGIGGEEARRISHSRDLTFNDQRSAIVASVGGDLYVYTLENDRAARLTYAPGDEELPTFSSDGALVAFVRNNDLFVVDVAMRRESRITLDGTPDVFNGKLDWVYEEEIYGRGQKRAFWWSPDSTRLAYLRLNDADVPTFPVVDHIPYDQNVEHWHYPKAGDPNPVATLGIARVAGGDTDWIDLSKYPAADRLVVAVSWTPDSRGVVCQVQNRTQTWLDLDVAAAGSTRTLFRETTKTWVDVTNGDGPRWLKDGSFLWLSERTGWKHVFHYGPDGTLLKQVTDGPWEVRTLHGVDESRGWIYFSGTEHSPIGGDVYRQKIDGGGLERLSRTEGTHAAVFSPALGFYIDSWSDATTPTKVTLHKSDGANVRTIDDNPAPLADWHLSTPEFLHVPTRDGGTMEAQIIKPPDFDPSRKYPVYQFTYGGVHAPQVNNAWGRQQYLYHQLLAQHGIIVWICDNRSASGKGIASAWPIYRNFGELELRDIEDGIAWLRKQPYVDGARIGIHGWSNGGFITAYALTHSSSFSMGIAGGTVSDWRDYDSVFTERYMGLPSENPEGYRKTAPRWAAKDLHGDLLLLHGAIDDNVHVANTIQLAYELQKAGKPFGLMLYPKSRHGISDPLLVKHLRQTMLDFTLAHLKP